jgi:chromosome segregation ATPase
MIFLFLFLISRIILKNNYLMSLTSINQIQTYEKEISLLKEKIDKSKYEKNEKEINLLEENNILKEKENEYETSLRTKDRKIKELLNLISEYENQIVQLNNQLNTLVNSNKQLKSIMFDLSTNYQKTKIKLSNEKEENKNNNDYISRRKYGAKKAIRRSK